MKRKNELVKTSATKNMKRKKSLSLEEKKKYCAGCYSDIYNYTDIYGNKHYCLLLRSAEVVVRDYRVPPFPNRIIVVNSCYRRPDYVYIDQDNNTEKVILMKNNGDAWSSCEKFK